MTHQTVRHAAKQLWHATKRGFINRYRSYTPAELAFALEEMGLQRGDSVMMHSRLSPLNGFRGQPAEILACVRSVIGDEGTLLMLSSSYRSSTRRYLETSPTFDARRTPSRMGLLVEVFRRTRGVIRSLNPAHPVLAQGPRASWFVAGHEATPFSCGDDTPFSRLVEADAKILFFDLLLRGFTFMHHVEHTLQAQLPFPLYDDRIFDVPVVTLSGDRQTVQVRAFSVEGASRRKVGVAASRMLKRVPERSRRIGNTDLSLISARDALREGHEAFAAGDMFRS